MKLTEEHRKNIRKARLGTKMPSLVKSKISASLKGTRTGENNPSWKGDNVGYSAIHNWVYKQLGKPSVCENCLKGNLYGRFIHWANISKEYKRDKSDWIRLCAKCHHDFDKKGIKVQRNLK